MAKTPRGPRIDKYRVLEALSPVAGFLASLIVLMIIVVAVGETPGNAISAIYRFCLSTPGRRAAVFSIAIPLYLSGLAVANHRHLSCRSIHNFHLTSCSHQTMLASMI